MRNEIEQIVDDAVKTYIQRQYLEATQEGEATECAGDVECLVSKNFDRRDSDIRALEIAVTFNSLADYDRVIRDMGQKLDGDNSSVRDGLEQFANAMTADDMDEGVASIMSPFNLIAVQDNLKRIAAAYAALSMNWKQMSFYYDGLKVETMKPGNIIGDHTANIIEIIKESGKFDDWNQSADNMLNGQQKRSFKQFKAAFEL